METVLGSWETIHLQRRFDSVIRYHSPMSDPPLHGEETSIICFGILAARKDEKPMAVRGCRRCGRPMLVWLNGRAAAL